MKLSKIYRRAALEVEKSVPNWIQGQPQVGVHQGACWGISEACWVLSCLDLEAEALSRFARTFKPRHWLCDDYWFGETLDAPTEVLLRNREYRVLALLLMAEIVEGEEA